MAKLQIKKGTTSKLLDIFIQDSSSTTGAGLTGLVWNSAGLTAYYYREGAASATAITLATMTLGTWATGGFIVVDGTNMPGCYQLGIPDAAIATGANSVIVLLKGATNMAPITLEIQLTDIDVHDSVRAGMTALPNAAAEAAGGLYTRGTGAGQIAQDANGNIRANLDTIKTQTVTCSAGVTVLASIGTATTSTAQTGDAYAIVNNGTYGNSALNTKIGSPAGASVSADIAAVKVDTAAILVDTTEIGAAGAGLTAIPWNIAWDAEVQSECTDALNAYDPPTKAEMDTAFTEVKGATWSSVTDTLEALRDRGDAAWITATGFATSAALATAQADLDTLTGTDGVTLATSQSNYAPLKGGTAMTESYAADGTTMTPEQALYMIWSALSEFAISGTTITCKKLDGSTTAMTYTLNDGTNPTSRTRAS